MLSINRSQFYLGVRIDNLSSQEAINKIEHMLADHQKRDTYNVFFANVHSIFLARKIKKFKQTLNTTDLILPDGSGLKIAARILGQKIKENLNGTDFIPQICKMAEQKKLSIYFLGGRKEVISKCVNNVQKQYPNLKIAGYHHGYIKKDNNKQIIENINSTNPDLLLVAMGSPRQEQWLYKNKQCLNTRVCFAVGGLFDFMSGEIPRAPFWMRRMGIEWVYRFFQDPFNKWKRVFVEIPLFLPLVIFEQRIPKK